MDNEIHRNSPGNKRSKKDNSFDSENGSSPITKSNPGSAYIRKKRQKSKDQLRKFARNNTQSEINPTQEEIDSLIDETEQTMTERDSLFTIIEMSENLEKSQDSYSRCQGQHLGAEFLFLAFLRLGCPFNK